MSNRTKNLLYTTVLLAIAFVVYQFRKQKTPEAVPVEPVMIDGRTMGTTYHMTYYDPASRNFKASVDSLLTVFNSSLNTYLGDSEISQFNKGTSFHFVLPFFWPVVQRSSEITRASGGAFDPTVMPLVNAWGFGPIKFPRPDSLQVDSILQFVGMEENIRFNSDSIWKTDPRTQLDFSAIAKGYGVDVVSGFLRSKGIDNHFVEIGGEVFAYGKNLKQDRYWSAGILDPSSTYDAQEFFAIATLRDRALATSGNYFNYRIENGVRYSHTLSPSTGYPAHQEILSASVFASDCMTADAWATAFMAMGHERAIELLRKHPSLEALLIYSGPGGTVEKYYSPGLEKILRFDIDD